MVHTTGPGPSLQEGPDGEARYRLAPGEDASGIVMRVEKDSLGELEVPQDAYWGIHTARALVNFPITRRAISNYPDLIRGIARVKQAAARANKDIGVLSAEKADVIDQVCEELWSGALHD